MDKFESIRAFTKVVEASGFAAAAREMGLSRSIIFQDNVRRLRTNLENLVTNYALTLAAPQF